jgi:hypothetical protein
MPIIIEGLDELRDRMAQFPGKFQRVIAKTLEASLLKLWENVPPYPPAPASSEYVRTGTLGRTLGAGGQRPDIYEVKQEGGFQVASFGTKLGYAPYVIGDNEQAWMHQNRWFVLGDVLNKSVGAIEGLFNAAADEMAKWLDGKGA